MLTKYEQVCYELLRPEQIKALREICPVAYIPTGTLEWHSFQNPLGTDSLKAHAICCEAALKHGGIVLPPYYQGLLGMDSWGPTGWSGYTLGFNEDEVFEAAMRGIVQALIFGQWKVIVGVSGHDVPEQREAMQKAIAAMTEGQGATGFALWEGELHELNDDIPYRMDHAGTWETSCMMYVYPDKADLNALRERKVSNVDPLDILGPEGIGGWNPLTRASSELGRRIIETMGDLIGAKARTMLAQIES